MRWRAAENRSDWIMAIVILLLTGIIGVVVARGDQIGIGVEGFSPARIGSSRAMISVTFDAPLASTINEGELTISPPLPGTLMVKDNGLRFQPSGAFQVGATYTITVRAGLASLNGRVLKHDLHWTFMIEAPRVVYLGPADSPVQDLWLVDPAKPETPKQLTDSKGGILDFDVSQDGGQIVYSELTTRGATNLMVYDVAASASHVLYACPDASCDQAVWRPDSSSIAFSRADLNIGLGSGPGAPRVWLLDPATGAIKPLFADRGRLGYAPRWSPDGRRLAVFDASIGGIAIYDFETGKDAPILSDNGAIGNFSPDGRWFWIPKITQVGENQYVTHLVLVDLAHDPVDQRNLIPDTARDDDTEAAWTPDSTALIVSRRAADQPAEGGAQFYRVAVASGIAETLLVDPAYVHGDASYDATGKNLVFQRFPLTGDDTRPQIWMYDLTHKVATHLASNGTFPRWLP